MGRHRATRRTAMQKLQRIKKHREKQRDEFDRTLVTFGELDEVIHRVFAEYDRANVLATRQAVAYLTAPFYVRWRYALSDWWAVCRGLVRRVLRRPEVVPSEEAAE